MKRTYNPIKSMTVIQTIILGLMTVLAFGCGEDKQEYICTVGELQVCPCVGGGESIQECVEDRQGWGQCQCELGDDQGDDLGGTSTERIDENGGSMGSGGEDGGSMDGGIEGGTENGGTDGGIEGGTENGGMDGGAEGGIENGGIEGGIENGGMNGGVEGGTESGGMSGATEGGADSGGMNNGTMDGSPVTIWAHTFNETLGPGTGLQPGAMETEGPQGFTDGGSWISTGGWLSKRISTLGYTTIEVDYLLTKDAESTCELNLSTDGGSTWTNVLSDRGAGGYRLNTTLPRSAENQSQVLLRWTAITAWCWMNDIIITALETDGGENGANSNSPDTTDAMGNGDVTTDPVFHLFLLMGQSNMVGCDLITPEDQITDERVSVLGYETCQIQIGFSNGWDIASPPLHTCSTGIGPGDYFAKTLAEGLPEGHTIGLIPTAVSGQWIETFLEGGIHHQNILDKIDLASGVEHARFSGIIFHQGESNNGDPTWLSKVQQLYTQVKAAMEIDYDLPFIAGEMLYGGNCEGHNTLVRQVPNLGNNFDYVSAEGLVMSPDDEWLVHFSHDSQVTLGRRYGGKDAHSFGLVA